MSAFITAQEAMAEVLMAQYELAEGYIEQSEYDEIARTFIDTVGEDASNRFAEIALAERMSPSDMAQVADDPTWIDTYLVRMGVK